MVKKLSPYLDLEHKTILDWGCGPCRVLRHLPQLLGNSNTYHGTDYNARTIAWCKATLSDIKFHHNGIQPALPYPDSHFDVIYGLSIFTHLSETHHFEWYRELRRVLKPNGIFLFTMQGENFLVKLTAQEKDAFLRGQLVVRGNVKEGHRTYSAFHPDPFLHSLFAHDEILEKEVIDPEGKSYRPQDTWIIRKLGNGATT